MPANKSVEKQFLKPINPLILVSSEKTHRLSVRSIKLDKVGEKAFGLACLPKPWTLPFLVVSDQLLSNYRDCNETQKKTLILDWEYRIQDAAQKSGINEHSQIIIRSSSQSEGLAERGRFHSVQGSLVGLAKALMQCLDKIISDDELGNVTVPLIVQQYADPVSLKGHLSNERRCYEERRDWLGEFEGGRSFTINLRNWRKHIDPASAITGPLECNLTAHVIATLKNPAAWAYEQLVRMHFEWVWDGSTIYIVQADQEYQSPGIDPTIRPPLNQRVPEDFSPQVLVPINMEHAKRFHKIHNVFTYIKLGLPRTKLYVLDDQKIVEELSKGTVRDSLKQDLAVLVAGSLVIRVDVDSERQKDRQLLPRSDEVRDLDSAVNWLLKNAKKIKNEDIQGAVVFLFHNFVPALSSAFAYAAPGKRKVQIEALWGLPEGLYYNAHDKYIVDTKNSTQGEISNADMYNFDIQFKPDYKHFFVTPSADGSWTTEILAPPYDWNGSIQKTEWIQTIALESRRIADEENKPLSIMWFVDVSSEVCSQPVFPWFHEKFDPSITSRATTHRTKTPFDKSLIIRTEKDIEDLKKEVENPASMVRRIRIQPSEEALLREKNTLRVIGELAKQLDAVILLEGGVLSHAYYQLIQTDAVVEVSHTFGDTKEKREFNKLVRDKVPSNIEDGGEAVSKAKLKGEFLLRALKEKLIEESFEVLDALDQDDIVAELADVSEVIDGILTQLGISRDNLAEIQERKRNKAGGFRDGLVLLETNNPLPAKVGEVKSSKLFSDNPDHYDHPLSPIEELDVLNRGKEITKWSDQRAHRSANETILDIEFPVTMDRWNAGTREAVIETDQKRIVRIKVSGERIGAKVKIGFSLYVPNEQLNLF